MSYWGPRFMNVKDLIWPGHIFGKITTPDKKSLLTELAEKAGEITSLSHHEILECLIEREKLSTTGIGNGVAIPHVRSPHINKIYGLFFHLETPVDFEAVDNQDVDLVFLLITPVEAGADHLRALSRVTRKLRDRVLCRKIRHCTTTDAIYSLLTAKPVATERIAA